MGETAPDSNARRSAESLRGKPGRRRPPPPPPPPADGTLRGGLDGRSRAILVGALEQGLFEALKLRADDPTAFLVAYLRARALPPRAPRHAAKQPPFVRATAARGASLGT